MKNIMEISNPNHIIELLHNDEFFYTVYFITSDKVPEKMNKYMKKWLLSTAKIYPNVLFCFYHATNNVLKKSLFYSSLDEDHPDKRTNEGFTLIKHNKDAYPLSYYFVGRADIMLQGTGITQSIIDDAYNQVKKNFKYDLEFDFTKRVEELKSLENNDNNDNDNNNDNNDNNNDNNADADNNEKTSKNPQEEYKKSVLLQKEIQFNDKLEKDKLAEKITVIGKCANTYLKEFISDIAKREKIEKGKDNSDSDSHNSDSDNSDSHNSDNSDNSNSDNSDSDNSDSDNSDSDNSDSDSDSDSNSDDSDSDDSSK